jgi:hypothetical protein
LTAVIAVAVVVQAWYMFAQFKWTKAVEVRQREAEEPRLKWTVSTVGKNGTHFVGFIATNASMQPVQITTIQLYQGCAKDSDGKLKHHYDYPEPTMEFNGQAVSDELPKRLRHGDTLRIHYPIQSLTHFKDGQPKRVQPQCWDSLGNVHKFDGWLEYEPQKTAVYSEPSHGYTDGEGRK